MVRASLEQRCTSSKPYLAVLVFVGAQCVNGSEQVLPQ